MGWRRYAQYATLANRARENLERAGGGNVNSVNKGDR